MCSWGLILGNVHLSRDLCCWACRPCYDQRASPVLSSRISYLSQSAGSASTLQSSSALLMAQAAAERFQLPASAMAAAAAASEGFGAAPDGLRLGDGFGAGPGAAAAAGVPGFSNELVQRAQLQVGISHVG